MRWQQYKYEYLCTLVYAANEHPTHKNWRKNTLTHVRTKKSTHCEHETLSLSNCIWFSRSQRTRRSLSPITLYDCVRFHLNAPTSFALLSRATKVIKYMHWRWKHRLTCTVHCTHTCDENIKSETFLKEFISNISSPVFAAQKRTCIMHTRWGCINNNAHTIHMQIHIGCSFLCASRVFSTELMEIYALKIVWKLRQEDTKRVRTNMESKVQKMCKKSEMKPISPSTHPYTTFFQVWYAFVAHWCDFGVSGCGWLLPPNGKVSMALVLVSSVGSTYWYCFKSGCVCV